MDNGRKLAFSTAPCEAGLSTYPRLRMPWRPFVTGTVEEPGTQIKSKSGLNRSILASGWGQLELRWSGKTGTLMRVNPTCTPQTCSVCGACGFHANADHNRCPTFRRMLSARLFGPWERSFCTAREIPVGDPNDPYTR